LPKILCGGPVHRGEPAKPSAIVRGRSWAASEEKDNLARCFQSTFQSQAHPEENWQQDEKSCQVREDGSCFGQEIRQAHRPPP
jgi:hypothetical protein